MTQRIYGRELLDLHFDRRMADVHTCIVCKVEAYDAAAQTVDVKPQISRYITNAKGEQVAEELPVLYSVPVAFPRAGGFHITMPIAAGDYMLVLCSEEPTIAWRSKAQAGEPGIEDRHGLNGCFAIPGGFPDKEKLGTAPATDAIEISVDGGAASVTVKGGEVLLGDNTASEFVALSNLVKSELDAIKADFDSLKSALDTHTHTGVTPGGGATGTSVIVFTPHTPGDVAAAKTKAK